MCGHYYLPYVLPLGNWLAPPYGSFMTWHFATSISGSLEPWHFSHERMVGVWLEFLLPSWLFGGWQAQGQCLLAGVFTLSTSGEVGFPFVHGTCRCLNACTKGVSPPCCCLIPKGGRAHAQPVHVYLEHAAVYITKASQQHLRRYGLHFAVGSFP